MSDDGYVYTINDPRTGDPKYVGATTNPKQRFSAFLADPPNKDVGEWLEALQDVCESPEMTIVKTVRKSELQNAEEETIEQLGDQYNLLNKIKSTQDYWSDDGGSTRVNAELNDETHKKLRIAAAEQNKALEDVVADHIEFAVEHRLAGAEPTTVPEDAARDNDGDPILKESDSE